jgi:hypothetical protein
MQQSLSQPSQLIPLSPLLQHLGGLCLFDLNVDQMFEFADTFRPEPSSVNKQMLQITKQQLRRWIL